MVVNYNLSEVFNNICCNDIFFFNTYSNNINLRHSNYLKNKYLLLVDQTETNSTRAQTSLNILENEIGNILNTVMNHISDPNRSNTSNNNNDNNNEETNNEETNNEDDNNDDTDTNEDINDDINNEPENNIDNQFEESKNNESDESTRNRINSNIYTFSLNSNLNNNLTGSNLESISNTNSENIFSNLNRFVRLPTNNITRTFTNNTNSSVNNMSPFNILGVVSNNTSTERFEIPRNIMMSITSTFMNELDSQMQENYQRFMDEINNLDNGESINRNPPISETEFENINVSKYVDIKKELDENNIVTNETCSICMENFLDNDDIIKSGCNGNHLFHKNCIKPWLLNMSKTCPICRSNMV